MNLIVHKLSLRKTYQDVKSIYPFTGQVIATFQESTIQRVNEIIDKTDHAFQTEEQLVLLIALRLWKRTIAFWYSKISEDKDCLDKVISSSQM